MKKRFFRFITYVVVFLCLYNNTVSAADFLNPNSPFDSDPRNAEVEVEMAEAFLERRGGGCIDQCLILHCKV